MPRTDTCYLHLIRHAPTASNLTRPPRLQGRGADLSLTDEGRQQAERTARLLAQRPLAAVYSSPLKRALETARILAEPHGLAVTVIESLIEADVGRWEGRSWQQIERDEPEAYRRFMADSSVHGYAGGENMTQVADRVVPALQAVMAAHVGGEIAAVAHNVVNRCYLGSLLEIPLSKCRVVPQENCGVNLLRYRAGHIRPLTINYVLHLDGIG